jgi:hypothetical protein
MNEYMSAFRKVELSTSAGISKQNGSWDMGYLAYNK